MKKSLLIVKITAVQNCPKDGAESTLCYNLSTGLVGIYEVKRSLCIGNNLLEAPNCLVFKRYNKKEINFAIYFF